MERDTREIEKILTDGDKLYDEGDIAQAKDTYNKVLKLGTAETRYDLVVDAYLRLGPIFSRQNEYSDMIKAYENALLLARTYKLKTKEPMIHKRLGDGYWRVGALTMARDYYRKCEETVDYIEDDAEKRFLIISLYIDGYGNLLDEEGKFKEAIEYYTKSLELLDGLRSKSKNDRAHVYTVYAKYNMGVAFERHGMSQEKMGKPARRWFREAVKRFEEVRDMCSSSSYEFAISTLDAGFCYSKLNSIKKADSYTEKALSILIKPQVNAKDLIAWGLMNRGIIARKRNDLNIALENFKQAIEIYEDIGIHEWVSMVYSELGLTYEMMGDKVKSREAYNRSKYLVREEREEVEVAEEIEQTD